MSDKFKQADDLYDEMVTIPAGDLSDMLVFAPGAEEEIRKMGLDPEDLLMAIRSSTYEAIKDDLRPMHNQYCKKNGIPQRYPY